MSCKLLLAFRGLLMSFVDPLMRELERRKLAAMLFFVVEGVRRFTEGHTSTSCSGAAECFLFDDKVAFMNELDARLWVKVLRASVSSTGPLASLSYLNLALLAFCVLRVCDMVSRFCLRVNAKGLC